MMFGAKKEAREPPVDRVRVMMRGGMSEKDIVRQLKAEGYTFGEIEKALMAVVKAGAAPLRPGAELGLPPGPAQRAIPPIEFPPPAPAPPAAAPVAAPPPEAAPPAYAPPPYEYPPAPAYPAYPEYPQAAYPPEEELQPEVIMEELIESVAEEKFEKFSADMKHLEDEFGKLRSELAAVREKAEAKPAPEVPKELGDRLDELDARIGGLEKAFKQMLPSIKENVEAISKMVSEKKHEQTKSVGF